MTKVQPIHLRKSVFASINHIFIIAFPRISQILDRTPPYSTGKNVMSLMCLPEVAEIFK